jgi:hypothetical protein
MNVSALSVGIINEKQLHFRKQEMKGFISKVYIS